MQGLRRFVRSLVSVVSILGLVSLYSPVPEVAAQQAPRTVIVITVQDASGVPVANAGVNVHPVSFAYSLFGNSGADGKATVQDFANQVTAGTVLIADVFPPFDSGAGLISPGPTDLGAAPANLPYAPKTIKFKGATKTLNVTATTNTGKAVTSTKINVFKELGGFAQATTDSAGKATVKLSGGRWNLHAENSPTNNFVLAGPPVQVTFAENETAETQAVTMNTFVEANATVTGTVKTPDGSPLPLGISIGVRSGHDFGFGAPIQAPPGSTSATFSAKVPGDRTYDLDIFSPPSFGDPNAKAYGAPAIDPFPVKVGETKNLGALTLVEKAQKIIVKISNAAAGMQAFAFKMKAGGGGDFGMTQLTLSGTEATGTIKVVGGSKYGIMAMAEAFGPEGGQQQQQAGTSKVIKGGPQFADVPATGSGPTVSFTAIDADATLKIRIIRSDTSAVLSESFGFMEMDNPNVGFLGKPIERGTATVKVPGGETYTLRPMMPMGGFMPEGNTTVTVAKNATESKDIKLIPTDATFNVKFVKSDGTAVTGIFAHAFAVSNDGINVIGEFAGHGGAAAQTNVKVVASKGPYRLGAFVQPGSGYAMIPPKDKFTIAAGENKEVKVTLKALDSTIKGKVTDPDGNPVVGAFVKIDNGLDDDNRDQAKGFVDAFFQFGGSSDKDGNYSIAVTSNETQNVRVFLSPEVLNKNGWLPPKEQIVTVGLKATHDNVNFQFRKADLKIEGAVKDGTGNVVANAFVSAYSDDGATNQVKAGSDGKYSMNATKDTVWHVDSAKDADNEKDVLAQTGETLVSTQGATGNVSQDLTLTTQTNFLPSDVTRTGGSGSASQITLTDGMVVQVPANALDKNNDDANVTVTVSATGEVASQEGTAVFGKGYDITASDNNGQAITSPNSPLTVTFPYKESDLPAGVSEADIVVVSNNPDTGENSVESGCAVDTEKNLVSCSIDHMTVFALAANADTTPPAAPTSAKATAGTGKVTLSWTNPSDSDFNGVAIYRSTEKGKLGDKVKTTAKADSSYADTLSAKGTYYYTLRSVDTASNESQNTNQVSAEVKSLPTTGRPGNPAGALATLIVLVGGALLTVIRRNVAPQQSR